MAWTADGYWTKAQTYIERAFASGDSTEQGLWAAMGLELLLRAAICQTHPALNAEPKDDDGVSLLVACGVPAGIGKTIPIKAVIRRLGKIHGQQFTKRRITFLEAFTFKRNDEVHGDAAAFASYPAAKWLPEFADAVIATCDATARAPTTLVRTDLAKTLQEHAASLHDRVKGEALAAVAAAKRTFEAMDEPTQAQRRSDGTRRAGEARDREPWQLGAKTCPACGAEAVVLGRAMRVGEPRVDEDDGHVVVERGLVAEALKCLSCGLALSGIDAVIASGTDPHWTVTVKTTLDEFMSPDDSDGYENM